ncbi:MAG: HAD-IA family hydrolase [Spirochaetaceae bacterium]
MSNLVKAVLFDMDGVLVDSEKFICQAAISMFKELGLTVKEEDFLPFVGAGENSYLGGVANKYDLDFDLTKGKKRTYDIYLEMIKGKLNCLPGVEEFIKECRKRDIKIAVATSADYVKMNANLEEIGLPAQTFDAVVNGLQVERKKPYPDIYKLAASLIDVDPKNCLVVEDAINGIEAAKAAGAKCLALTTSFPRDLLQQADWIIPDLSYVNEVIEEMFVIK